MAEILSRQELLEKLGPATQRPQPLVFTNGCFDLLHAGHARYLKEARGLGKALVVALNSDASVSRLKGSDRPLVSQAHRCELMAALACVDWVTVFDEDTPIPLLEELRPDILVKGGDYGPQGVVGAPQVKAYGGQVKVLSLAEGISTSEILKKARGG